MVDALRQLSDWLIDRSILVSEPRVMYVYSRFSLQVPLSKLPPCHHPLPDIYLLEINKHAVLAMQKDRRPINPRRSREV
jgi:hypothetical protein